MKDRFSSRVKLTLRSDRGRIVYRTNFSFGVMGFLRRLKLATQILRNRYSFGFDVVLDGRDWNHLKHKVSEYDQKLARGEVVLVDEI